MNNKNIVVKVKVFENLYQDLYEDLINTPVRRRAEKMRKLCILGYLTKNNYLTGNQTMGAITSKPPSLDGNMFDAFDNE